MSSRNLADPNGLDNWRAWHAEQDQQRAEAQAAMRREERRETKTLHNAQLRTELHDAITELRADMEYANDVHTDAVGGALGELRGEVRDHIETVLKEIRTEYRSLESQLFQLVERKFGELAGRLDAAGVPDRSRAKADSFRFAGEKSNDDDDLPNPTGAVN